jgi:hypothetical protein
MLSLNQAKSAGSNARYAVNNGSPLRSKSPPRRDLNVRTEMPVNHRKFDLNQSNSKSNRKRSGSSNLRNSQGKARIEKGMSMGRTTANTAPFNDMLHQIETLQRERAHYASVAFLYKKKHADLEREFYTLRELIS